MSQTSYQNDTNVSNTLSDHCKPRHPLLVGDRSPSLAERGRARYTQEHPTENALALACQIHEAAEDSSSIPREKGVGHYEKVSKEANQKLRHVHRQHIQGNNENKIPAARYAASPSEKQRRPR